MKSLRPPYKAILRAELDDDARERMWRRIEARARQRSAPPRVGTAGLVLGGVAGAIVLVMIARSSESPARVLVGAQPLLVTASAAARPSSGVASPSHYVAHGDRRTIDVGLARLTFSDADVVVEPSPHHLMIRVERGEIDVESPHVRGGAAHLSAGMLLEIDDEPSAPIASASAPLAPHAPSWRALAAQGANPEAYAALGDGGVGAAAAGASVDDLLTLADVARLSGHPREAVAPLQRVLRDHATDGRAALAAFTLGRVELDELGEPAAAATAFDRAIALGVPRALEEDAYARLVEAYARAGDDASARLAYDRAVARFPGGAREPAMRRWVERR